jgi:hypothetical protein
MVFIVRTTWAGLQGGPGITQMAFESDPPGNFIDATQAQTVVNAVRAFWNSIVSDVPNDVVLTVQPAIDSYATATGELGSTIVAATPPSSVTGGSASNYSAASGGKIKLLTAGIKNNRRVRGAIFLVPLGTGAYDSNGGVVSSLGTTVATAYATLATALAAENLSLGVWSRPVGTPPGTGGSWYPVTGVQVPTKVAVLRGRRDA